MAAMTLTPCSPSLEASMFHVFWMDAETLCHKQASHTTHTNTNTCHIVRNTVWALWQWYV